MLSSSNKSLLILYVLNILKEDSDEKNPLTQKEIKEKLFNIYGVECDRKTVAEKIESLIFAGFDIIKVTGGGCYLGERELEPSEISFLIDAVFSSRSINAKNSRALAEKLSAFLSKKMRKKYNYIYKSDEILRTSNKQLFYTIDVLHEAIEKKKQVEFCYEKVFLSEGKKVEQSNKHYVINPYFLVNSQGRYYLVCNNDKYDDIANYRLELIKDINILDFPSKPITSVKNFENGIDIAKYVNENFYMMSSKTVSATLKLVSEQAVNNVIDWFGKDTKIYKKNDEIFADVKASEYTLVYWCLQYGEIVELISPQSTREKIKKQIENLNKRYS